MEKDPFKEYLKESEPDKAYKGYAWSTAIGLQAVDGLKPSKYLIETAIQTIEGKITIKEAKHLIDSYYEEKTVTFVGVYHGFKPYRVRRRQDRGSCDHCGS